MIVSPKKDSVITIRVSKADKERYAAQAKSYGMKTSKYILCIRLTTKQFQSLRAEQSLPRHVRFELHAE